MLISIAAFLAALVAGCGPGSDKDVSHLPDCYVEPAGDSAGKGVVLVGGGVEKKAPLSGEITAQKWYVASNRPWKYIVVHHSAGDSGNVEEFNDLHVNKRGWDELGYHFVITNGNGGPDGEIQMGSRWAKQKWGAHCGGSPNNEYNNFGIGICLVGDFSNSMPTQKQLDSLEELLEFLCVAYDIPENHITTHRDAPGANTACPGLKLWKYVHSPDFMTAVKDNRFVAKADE